MEFKMQKITIYKISLIFFAAWFWTTALVDFVAVPTVFRTIESLAEAGRVGIKIFSLYNLLEIFFGTVLVFCVFKLRAQKWGKLIVVWCVILLIQVLFYKFYITKEIANAATQMHTLDALSPEFAKLVDTRAFYHQLYVNLDKFKLCSLLFLIIKFFRIRAEELV
jgi:hypothetical protein